MVNPESAADAKRSNRNGLWLVLALVAVLLVSDFFYGSLTRPLLLGQASVSVSSAPEGAAVFADTQRLGVTPLEDGKLLPGDYVLRVEHPHFEPVREAISVARGDRIERTLALQPATGDLLLVSNPKGAAIRLNGELQSEVTPARLEDRKAGVYDVELLLDGRKPARQRLDVRRNQTAEMNADLNRAPVARLTLELEPEDARVEFLDSQLAYAADMSLAPGDYKIRVTRDGFAQSEQQIKLHRGNNSQKIKLERRFGDLKVSVDPVDARVTVRANGRTQIYSERVSMPTGTVRLTAALPGYRTASKTIELTTAGAQVALNLEPYRVTPGRVFRDPLSSGGEGPELVVLDVGAFRMGDLSGQGAADERPAHRVQLQAPFALGVKEVSVGEWNMQFPRARRPASDPDAALPKTSVSKEKIEDYLQWLSQQTGKKYRLPSEAEWEYAARGGTETTYGVASTEAEVCKFANVADLALEKDFP